MTSPAVKLLAGLGGGGVAPDPPSITSKVAEWWAQDLVGVVLDGDPVSTWSDRVGSADLTQSGTARPTFDANGVGGQPCIDFDGSNDQLRYGTSNGVGISSATLGVVVAVVQFDTNDGVVWSTSYNATTDRWLAGFNYTLTTNDYIGLQALNTSSRIVRGGTNIQGSRGSTHVFEWSSSDTAYSLRVDNNAESITVVAGSNDGTWHGDFTLRNTFSVGCLERTTKSNFMNGRIAYLMVADAELSAGDRTDLYDWINEVYGI